MWNSGAGIQKTTYIKLYLSTYVNYVLEYPIGGSCKTWMVESKKPTYKKNLFSILWKTYLEPIKFFPFSLLKNHIQKKFSWLEKKLGWPHFMKPGWRKGRKGNFINPSTWLAFVAPQFSPKSGPNPDFIIWKAIH